VVSLLVAVALYTLGRRSEAAPAPPQRLAAQH
jgi:hypothetical protein